MIVFLLRFSMFVLRSNYFVLVTQLSYYAMQIKVLSISKQKLAPRINTITSVKMVDFILVYFCEATDSMQYRLSGSFKENPLRLRFWPFVPTHRAATQCVASFFRSNILSSYSCILSSSYPSHCEHLIHVDSIALPYITTMFALTLSLKIRFFL